MSDIGWGIIGVPNGFQHISEGITANSTINIVDKRICKEDFLEPLFAVIYDTAIVEGSNNRQLMTYFVQYNFAREEKKDRPGSFYGSYVVLAGVVPEDTNCYKVIVSLLKNLSDYNRGFFVNNNNRFKKDYSDDRENYDLNSDDFKEAIDLIRKHTVSIKSITQKYENRKDVIVFSDDVMNVFLNSMELYGAYSTIYITNSKAYCEYIKSKEIINCKEVTDLEKETLDIKETRKREVERIRKEEQDRLEAKQAEKEEQEKVLNEKLENDKKKIIKDFDSLKDIYIYMFIDYSELNTLIESNEDFSNIMFLEELNLLSKNLESFIKISNGFAKNVEDKKVELDREIRRLEGGSYELNDQPNLVSSSSNNEPFKKISKTNNNYSSNSNSKKQNHNPQPNRVNEYSDLDNNGFSVINIILWIVIIVATLAIIASAYLLFFDGESKHPKAANVYSSTQTSDEISTIEPVIENSGIPVEFLDECNHGGSQIEYYSVSTMDVINTADDTRFDTDTIVSRITDSILNEDQNMVSNEDKSKFKKMLIDCNNDLKYTESYYINKEGMKIYNIDVDSKVKYIKLTSIR